MLAGRVYRIFQRYADARVAFELPGVVLHNAAGVEVARINSVKVSRNRLWLSGHASAQQIEMQVNRTLQTVSPDAVGAFAMDIPLEVGAIDIRVRDDEGEVTHRLPGVRAAPLARARRRQGACFVWQLACLTPQIYRWKWRGDLGAREVVKERLGLVHRPEAAVLHWPLFCASAPPALPVPRATLVMPVFNAFDVLPEALDRVVRHSGEAWRLVVVEDCSTDARVRPFLENWCAQPELSEHVTLMCLPQNMGFVGAANHGLTKAQDWAHDPVVLLNSDALVPAGWLTRLLAPLQDKTVASVTPMSNDAEIFSVPNICQRSDLARGAGDAIDAVAVQLDPLATCAEVPTGVGFCMALSPDFLAQVPLFDTAFGRGYGEENDWSQKTAALGGRHVGVGNLFVEHRGGTSFGTADKQRLLERNFARLERRYPSYNEQVQTFILNDPLTSARLALGFAWAAQHHSGAVPVYLAHALGGGAELDLERRIAQEVSAGAAAVVLRVGLRHRWQIEMHSAQGVTRGLTDETATVLALLSQLAWRRIIYSCGVGDRDAVTLPDILLQLAEDGAHPIEVLMHDYFPISPSYTLLGSDGLYSGAPLAGDTLASDPAHEAPRPSPLPGATLAEWQDAWGRLMAVATRVTVFSQSSYDLVAAVYPQAEPVLEITPHVLLETPAQIRPVSLPDEGPVIGVLGNIGVQKGAGVVQALANDLVRTGTGRVVVIGYMDPDYDLTLPSQVHGAYELRDLPGLVARYGITCWLIPSIWPETFSFTTHEALATGLPVFAFDLGAQGEAVARAVEAGAPGGVLAVETMRSPDLRRILLQSLEADRMPLPPSQ